jgi:hypothetical protein
VKVHSGVKLITNSSSECYSINKDNLESQIKLSIESIFKELDIPMPDFTVEISLKEAMIEEYQDEGVPANRYRFTTDRATGAIDYDLDFNVFVLFSDGTRKEINLSKMINNIVPAEWQGANYEG